jgi:MFS family permease
VSQQDRARRPRAESAAKPLHHRVPYKWIALSNTTLGVLMASLNSSITIISLPAIFNGIKINPLVPSNTDYLLWMLLGFMIVSAVTLVTFGRLSDMYGRVRLYNAGFLVFTVGSLALYGVSLWMTGKSAALALILLRLVQGIGAAFLFANSAAILTDAFPFNERGLAMGVNQIAGIGGGLIGLILGGVLSVIDWHLIFLVSVPVGLAGTIWAYVALRESTQPKADQHIDWWGNLFFAVGLVALLLGFTYAIMPYGGANMGWGNPMVQIFIGLGVVLLAAFIVVERRVAEPMFHLELFKIRAFSAGNLSQFLAGIARGGLQFMLVIWLQGIWLPLHGVNFVDAPLRAAIDMIPLMVGFLAMGPVSGWLSDRWGPRVLATTGMFVNVAGFLLLSRLPADFSYLPFAVLIFFLGVGQGMFSAPNTAAIMNSVPAAYRGASSGMRATFTNSSMMFSIAVFFSILVLRLSQSLPATLFHGLARVGIPTAVAAGVSHLPPIEALFAALLGYNPMANILPAAVLRALPAASRRTVLGNHFFPHLISPPFMAAMSAVMLTAAALAFVAALASMLRGKAYIHELDSEDR